MNKISENLLDWADELETANLRNRVELPHESGLIIKEERIQQLVRDLHIAAGHLGEQNDGISD